MGGGRVKFLPELKKDPIYESINGSRSDGIDLIEKWKEDKANQKARANVVYTRDQLDKVNISETDYLLGKLFSYIFICLFGFYSYSFVLLEDTVIEFDESYFSNDRDFQPDPLSTLLAF